MIHRNKVGISNETCNLTYMTYKIRDLSSEWQSFTLEDRLQMTKGWIYFFPKYFLLKNFFFLNFPLSNQFSILSLGLT